MQSQLYNDTFTLERFYLQLSVVKEVHIFLHGKSLHLNSCTASWKSPSAFYSDFGYAEKMQCCEFMSLAKDGQVTAESYWWRAEMVTKAGEREMWWVTRGGKGVAAAAAVRVSGRGKSSRIGVVVVHARIISSFLWWASLMKQPGAAGLEFVVLQVIENMFSFWIS